MQTISGYDDWKLMTPEEDAKYLRLPDNLDRVEAAELGTCWHCDKQLHEGNEGYMFEMHNFCSRFCLETYLTYRIETEGHKLINYTGAEIYCSYCEEEIPDEQEYWEFEDKVYDDLKCAIDDIIEHDAKEVELVAITEDMDLTALGTTLADAEDEMLEESHRYQEKQGKEHKLEIEEDLDYINRRRGL